MSPSKPRSATDCVLATRGLELRRDGRAVLGPLDWTVRPGERWVVMGPNGCGKSTLAQCLQGRLHPWDGRLEVLGIHIGQEPLQSLWKRIGFAGDTLERLVDPGTNLLLYVATAMLGTVGVRFAKPGPKLRQRALEELHRWGIDEIALRPFHQVSLGQRRKAHIARALVGDPELLLLDEPFAGLDPVARFELLRRVEAWSEIHPTLPFVLITHHVEEIPSTTTHLLLLGSDGSVLHSGPLRAGLRSPAFSQAFGRPLRVGGSPGRWVLGFPALQARDHSHAGESVV